MATHYVMHSQTIDNENITALKSAYKKGDADAALKLAEIYYDNYNPDTASDYLDTYLNRIGKGRLRKPDMSDNLGDRIERMESMLESVEDIVIIDSINVPRKNFFKHYALTPEAGSITGASNGTTVYTSPSGRNRLWSETATVDSLSRSVICESWRLIGDEWDTPVRYDDLIDAPEAAYPFVMPDGITMYFAADGDESLGGYDIFMTRRDDGGWLTPQNIGMPFNSPYDDYLLAIDEESQLGWWATDRNQLADSVTIYVFIPAETRINVSVDDPDMLRDRARIASIAQTRRADTDYTPALQRLTQLRQQSATKAPAPQGVAIAMPDGTVRHSVDDFRRRDAREAYGDYVDLTRQLDTLTARLDALRIKYRNDRSVASQIKSLEAEQARLRASRSRLASTIATLEGL